MNKILILTIAVLIIGAFFILKPSSQNRCGDGVCDAIEQENPSLCPVDCSSYVRDCKKENELCGGVVNKLCCKGLICELESNNPESKGLCVGTDNKEICSDLDGEICDSDEICSGFWLDVSDNDYCCDGSCGNVKFSISEVSSPIKPFSSNGDLWFSTWADDDSVFVTWGDGFGVNLESMPPYSHNGLAKLTGTFPDINAEIVNNFLPLSDDTNNSKPSGALYYGGRLYVAIHSPLLYPDKGFIAYSDDNGETFNYNLDTPWTKDQDSKFISRMFINIGKGYDLNEDDYVYAFGIGSETDWEGSIYLARVKKENILDYNLWEYYNSPDSSPSWSANQNEALPIQDISSSMLFSSIYHPGLDRYVLLTAEFSKGNLYVSKNPWGDWTLVGEWFDDSSEWFTSYMPGIIPKDLGSNSFYFVVSGREAGKDGGPDDERYKYRIGEIILDEEILIK